MDGQNESVILDVKLDAGKVAQDLNDMVTRIAALKTQQSELTKEIKAGNDVNGKYAEQLLRVKDQLSWCEKQAKGLSATTKLLTADTDTYSDSLNGQRQKLADMQKAYDQLDRSQRESEGGKQFLEAIKAQHDAVLELEGATGRMQRNVGNYPKALTAVIPGFNKLTGAVENIQKVTTELGNKAPNAFAGFANGIKSATTAGLKFIMTPIGAIIAAIVVVVKAAAAIFGKLTEAFQRNDKAGTQLQKLFAVFTPIVQGVSAAFDKLAGVLGNVAEKIADFVGGMSDAVSEAQQLVTATDNLEEAERQYTVNAAKRSRDIARMREESAESPDLATREAKLKEAIALEEEDLLERKQIAAERLRILEAEAKANSDTSDATANKIAEARAAMYQAEEQYYTGVRKLQKELSSVQAAAEKEEQDRRKAAIDAANKRKAEQDKAAQEQAEALKAQRKAEQEIQQQAEDFALSLIQDETEKAVAARRIQGEREIEALRSRLETDKNLTDAARDQLAELIKGKQAQLDADLLQMVNDAAANRTEAEYQAEQERAARILELRAELAQHGSEEELQIRQAQLDLQLAQALEAENLTEEEKYLIRETFAKKAMELDQQYNDNLVKTAENARKQYKASLMQTAQQASSTFSAMSDLLATYGEENEKAAAASRAFGIASIVADQAISIANTAKAITEAVAGATAAAAAGGPAAPALLAAYIATMVGAVLGAVASVAGSIQQAKSLMAQGKGGENAGNYSGGGVIPGTSYSGDKLTANVNSAEVISNPRQAANLLYEISNNPARGGFDYGRFVEAMAAANEALPNPVMNYDEFARFNRKRLTFNEIAKI